MTRKPGGYEVFLAAREHGWSEEVHRLSMYGDRLTIYRRNGQTIRVETGHSGGGVKWCDRFEGESRRGYTHLNSSIADKAASVIHWMTYSW